MRRYLIRAREAIRRAVGKPGRRRGVDRRKGNEISIPESTGQNFIDYKERTPTGGTRRLTGPDIRSGKDRRKKK